MKIDNSPGSQQPIAGEASEVQNAGSADTKSSESKSIWRDTGDSLERPLEASELERALDGASNSASSADQSEDGSVDGVPLQEIQRREQLFASYWADTKLAAGGDLEAYKRLVVFQTGKEPTREQVDIFKLGGGLPLLATERQVQILGDPIDSKAYTDRWARLWQDYKKALGGDLDAWKRFNASLHGREIDFAEEFQFEDSGGPNVPINERQMQLLGTKYPQEQIDRMANLQQVVEKAINGDSKAQSQVEAAFGMTPGSLSGDALKNPETAAFIQSVTGYAASQAVSNANPDPKSDSVDSYDGFAALHPFIGADSAVNASPESAVDAGTGSDPSEWSPFPGESSGGSDSGAAVGVNAVDVREDGSVLIVMSDGTSKEFSDVGAAMEWRKQSGVDPAKGSGGAAESSSTSTSGSSTTQTTVEKPEENEAEPATEESTEEETVDEESEDESEYVNPDADVYHATELSESGKLKLEGGGFTDGRPELANDTPTELDPSTADRYRFVRDQSPDGDPDSAMDGTLNLNNQINPETRPELQGDTPEKPQGPDINPYAGKG